MSKMKLPSTPVLVFNGAAILIGLASVIAVARTAMFAPSVPLCSERYEQGTRLSLDTNGEPVSTGELQGRLGNTDWGLINGARVVKLKSGPTPFALEYNLATAAGADAPLNGFHRAGIGFTWSPDGMARAKAACLTYDVFVPETFAFGKGGRLPGLMGSGPIPTEEDVTPWSFSTRMTWDADGRGDFYPQLPNWPEGRPLSNSTGGFKLARGRWVKVEQEIILNRANQHDGVLRAWVDGSFVFERKDVLFRERPSINLSGVLAEAVAGAPVPGVPKGDQKLWFSPFQVLWN